ncbi:hypothetical protein KBC31_00020 [Candidatus Saccharibacteria bacterium]|nr:hypothetical protein [Candidatus Saccharibacteria bacterium]
MDENQTDKNSQQASSGGWGENSNNHHSSKDSDGQKVETGVQHDDSTTRGTERAPRAFTPPPMAIQNDQPKSALIAGFSIGVAAFGLIGSWLPILNFFSIIIALVAIVLGIIGLFKSNKALSATGIIIGVITIFVAISFNVLFFVFAADESNNSDSDATKSEGLYQYNEKQDDFYESI